MKSFAVIGMGRFGSAIAVALYEQGHDVMAVDKCSEKIQAISNKVTHAVTADVTDEEVVKSLGISNFDAVVISIASDMETSILLTVMLRDLNVGYIIAKAQNDIHARILEKVGADKIVFPERDTAYRIAHNIAISNVINYIEVYPNFNIVEIEIPSKWVDRPLKDLALRAKYGLNVIAVKDTRLDHIDTNPGADTVLKSGQTLVVSGTEDAIKEINKIK